jgi:uncharacterized protein YkwD
MRVIGLLLIALATFAGFLIPQAAGATTIHVKSCAAAPDRTAEQLVLSLINQHRAVAGVPLLRLNRTLSLASRGHSCEMQRLQKLQHQSADGGSPFDRFTRLGVTFMAAGENIADSSGVAAATGIDEVDSMMIAEPLTVGNHHWNIVNASYTSAGIGVVYVKGQLWLTEDFVG